MSNEMTAHPRIRARTHSGGTVTWGYAGVWPGEFNTWQGDRTINEVHFLVDNGFETGHIGLGEMRDPARRDQVAELVTRHELRLSVGVHMKWFEDGADEIAAQTEAFLADLNRYHSLLRTPIVTTGAGRVHRFMGKPSLDEQLELLSRLLGPIANGCNELGIPFGIENHGDYYCGDLVRLCRATPHLGIFLDTGNTFLIGEKSVPACREAAPYVIGTHFKDHLVHPDPRELKFVIEGAALGEGHVGLAEIYRILLDEAPGDVVMQWEMVPPKSMDAYECLERSWSFIRNLPEA